MLGPGCCPSSLTAAPHLPAGFLPSSSIRLYPDRHPCTAQPPPQHSQLKFCSDSCCLVFRVPQDSPTPPSPPHHVLCPRRAPTPAAVPHSSSCPAPPTPEWVLVPAAQPGVPSCHLLSSSSLRPQLQGHLLQEVLAEHLRVI